MCLCEWVSLMAPPKPPRAPTGRGRRPPSRGSDSGVASTSSGPGRGRAVRRRGPPAVPGPGQPTMDAFLLTVLPPPDTDSELEDDEQPPVTEPNTAHGPTPPHGSPLSSVASPESPDRRPGLRARNQALFIQSPPTREIAESPYDSQRCVLSLSLIFFYQCCLSCTFSLCEPLIHYSINTIYLSQVCL